MIFVVFLMALTIGARENLYFKPDAGKLLISPADETPRAPSMT